MAVLPGVDERPVDRLLIRKDRLDLLEDFTAAFCGVCGENRRNAECFGRPGETMLLITIVGSWLLTFASCDGW
jgi:hypothetical protein